MNAVLPPLSPRSAASRPASPTPTAATPPRSWTQPTTSGTAREIKRGPPVLKTVPPSPFEKTGFFSFQFLERRGQVRLRGVRPQPAGHQLRLLPKVPVSEAQRGGKISIPWIWISNKRIARSTRFGIHVLLSLTCIFTSGGTRASGLKSVRIIFLLLY